MLAGASSKQCEAEVIKSYYQSHREKYLFDLSSICVCSEFSFLTLTCGKTVLNFDKALLRHFNCILCLICKGLSASGYFFFTD